MAIDKITIENFKAFGTKQTIPLRKLNLIFGPNSSGKSSIVHSLAFLRYLQATGNCDPHRIMLPGWEVDLGGFQNLLHRHDESNPMRIAVTTHLGTRVWHLSSNDKHPRIDREFWKIEDSAHAWHFEWNQKTREGLIDGNHPSFSTLKSEVEPLVMAAAVLSKHEFEAIFARWKSKKLKELHEASPDRAQEPATEWLSGTNGNRGFLPESPDMKLPLDKGIQVFAAHRCQKREFRGSDPETLHRLALGIKAPLPHVDAIWSIIKTFGPSRDEAVQQWTISAFSKSLPLIAQCIYNRSDQSRFHSLGQEFAKYLAKTVLCAEISQAIPRHLCVSLGKLLLLLILQDPQATKLTNDPSFRARSSRPLFNLSRCLDRISESSSALANEMIQHLIELFHPDDLNGKMIVCRLLMTTNSKSELDAEPRATGRHLVVRLLDIRAAYPKVAFTDGGREEKLILHLSNHQHIPALRPAPPRRITRRSLLEGIYQNPIWEAWLRLFEYPNEAVSVSHSLHSLCEMNVGLRKIKEVRSRQFENEMWLQEGDAGVDESEPEDELVFVRDDGLLLSHCDLGFGISPLLPILAIMATMRSRRDSEPKNVLLSIEEPEQHLHPKLQAELGDAFLEWALDGDGNQMIIETHSEHLILRILRRIRETTAREMDDWPDALKQACPNGILPEDVAVLYVQPGPEGSEVIELPVTPDGGFSRPWPGGFFAERVKEIYSIVE